MDPCRAGHDSFSLVCVVQIVVGHGMDEDEAAHVTAQRRVLGLHLQVAAVMYAQQKLCGGSRSHDVTRLARQQAAVSTGLHLQVSLQVVKE